MNLPDRVREHYIEMFPLEAAQVVAGDSEPGVILENLSPAGAARLLEHTDPSGLENLFMGLEAERRSEVLQLVNIRTAILIMRSLTTEDREVALESLRLAISQLLTQILYPSIDFGF